jgi:hypothetical protein
VKDPNQSLQLADLWVSLILLDYFPFFTQQVVGFFLLGRIEPG